MWLLKSVIAQGWNTALYKWRVLLPLYVASLLLGAVQIWPLLMIGGEALYNPFLGRLAAGGADNYMSLLLNNPTGVGQLTLAWVMLALLCALLFSLSYNFFSGGILSVYAGTLPFWAGCRRTFLSFTGLGMLLLVLLTLLLPVSLLFGWLFGFWGAIIALLSLLQIVNLIGEYARAVAVIRGRRNPFVLLAMAIGFCSRNAAGVLVLALLGLILHATLVLAAGMFGVVVAGAFLTIVGQQITMLGWLWMKLVRLAWALSYVRGVDMAGHTPEVGYVLRSIAD